jgi:4-hydroxybenzoate polyprenyltransferase
MVSTAASILGSMRPKQWTKNLLVFAALVFSGNSGNARAWVLSALAFVVFSAVSGAVYVMNDIQDADQDRGHEKKRLRPIASGQLSPRLAAIAAVSIALVASLLGWAVLGPEFLLVTTAYLALQAAYTIWLKHEVILDVMTISVGFVLRAVAGAVAIGVQSSPWLLACTALLALVLALGKRRHELILLEDEAADHRAVLNQYSPEFIDQMLTSAATCTIITYLLYTFFSSNGVHRPWLMITVPFVAYGLYRYLFLVYKHGLGDEPAELLLGDAPLASAVVLFLGAVILALRLG